MDPILYLDNNATTAVAEEVLEAMRPYFSERYGNPSSMHAFGGRVAGAVEKARAQVAHLLGCHPTEILFTSGGTESDNTAIRSALAVTGRHHLVTTRVEHPAVRGLCRMLAGDGPGGAGVRLTELPVDQQGVLSLPDVGQALDRDTALVTVMWANNETGVLFPVEKIAAMCRDQGILFHTDAVQAVGKIPLRLQDTAIDMLSLSGHKLHAPKGIGALYLRRGTRFHPFLVGGHQEDNRRAGTEAVPLIVGLGAAAERAAEQIDREQREVRRLRDRLEKGLLEACPGALRNGHPEDRLPNTSNISFEFIEGESILLMLDEYGICASSGSACTTGSLEPSHVLRAMGVPFTAAHGSVRFSLSRYTTEREIDRVIEVLPPIIRKLRAISPFGRDQLGS